VLPAGVVADATLVGPAVRAVGGPRAALAEDDEERTAPPAVARESGAKIRATRHGAVEVHHLTEAGERLHPIVETPLFSAFLGTV